MAMLFFSSSEWFIDQSSKWLQLLKGWLKDEVSLAAIVCQIFSTASQAKSIFVLQKKGDKELEPFVYPLTSLQDQSALLNFKEKFSNWSKGTEI